MIVAIDVTNKRLAAPQVIRDKYAVQLQALVKPYSDEEVKTWGTQIKEADAYLVDPTAKIPFVTGMANSRGISVARMVEKIKENEMAYSEAAGNILGLQQKELDSIKN